MAVPASRDGERGGAGGGEEGDDGGRGVDVGRRREGASAVGRRAEAKVGGANVGKVGRGGAGGREEGGRRRGEERERGDVLGGVARRNRRNETFFPLKSGIGG